MRDITVRKDMERRLHAEKERYRVAMESSMDLLFEYDIAQDSMYSWGMAGSGGLESGKSYVPDYLNVLEQENLVDYVHRSAWRQLLLGKGGEEPGGAEAAPSYG